MAQLERDVAAATRSIHAQVMSFEGDEAGTHFASLLTGRRDLERTLIIDRYSRFHISDRFLPSPRNILKASLWRERRETLRVAGALAADGVRVHWTNPVGFCFLEFVSRNHKKSVVIDDRIVYLGGINVCDHNFAWHDFMLRIEDERAGAFMRDDIRATLRGREPVEPARLRELRDRAARRRAEPAADGARPAPRPRGPQVDRRPERVLHISGLRRARRCRGPGRGGHAGDAEAQQHARDAGLPRMGRRAGRRDGAVLQRPHEPHQGHARR